MVIAPARRAGDSSSNPGPGENFSLKLLTRNWFASAQDRDYWRALVNATWSYSVALSGFCEYVTDVNQNLALCISRSYLWMNNCHKELL